MKTSEVDWQAEFDKQRDRANEAERHIARLNKILVSLEYWLIHLDPKDAYCGFELEFGIERDRVLEKIAELRSW